MRLIGPGADAFLRAHFSRAMRVGRCVHGQLRDGARLIDDPVVVALPGAGADVNLHGGTWVVRSMLELAGRAGFEIVENGDGPPPLDAFEGEDLLEREMLAHLPLARTELALRALLAQPAAWQKLRRSAPPRERLDAMPARFDAMGERLDAMRADLALWHLLHPPIVAIVGAANVGKSTLANQLFGRVRSITADLPGTTRDWVGEIANVNGLAVMLLDTPGIRSTDDPIEHAAIAGSVREIERSEMTVLVLDVTRPLEPEQAPLLARWPGALRIANKSDGRLAWDAASLDALPAVATTGQGVQAIRKAIAKRFGCDDFAVDQARWWTERQRSEELRIESFELSVTAVRPCQFQDP